MCWRTVEKKYASPKVAEKDIVVFKIVVRKDGKYQPAFYGGMVIYKKGQTYALGDSIKVDTDYSLMNQGIMKINKGFHSYDVEKVSITLDNGYGLDNDVVFAEIRTIEDNRYVASYISEPYEHKFKMNCIIPKGTTYYENEIGEMVSEYIRVINFEPLKIHEE